MFHYAKVSFLGGADIATQYSNKNLNNAWFSAGTTLPETNIKAPVRKTTEAHYRYNPSVIHLEFQTIGEKDYFLHTAK